MDYEIDRVIPHENYDLEDKSNDIALIKLKTKIDFSTPFVKPVCLPFAKEYRFQNGFDELGFLDSKEGWVAGWGRTKWSKLVKYSLRILTHKGYT